MQFVQVQIARSWRGSKIRNHFGLYSASHSWLEPNRKRRTASRAPSTFLCRNVDPRVWILPRGHTVNYYAPRREQTCSLHKGYEPKSYDGPKRGTYTWIRWYVPHLQSPSRRTGDLLRMRPLRPPAVLASRVVPRIAFLRNLSSRSDSRLQCTRGQATPRGVAGLPLTTAPEVETDRAERGWGHLRRRCGDWRHYCCCCGRSGWIRARSGSGSNGSPEHGDRSLDGPAARRSYCSCGC